MGAGKSSSFNAFSDDILSYLKAESFTHARISHG